MTRSPQAPQEITGDRRPAGGGRGFALVTGANSGIGKEVARQLLSAGFSVYVGSRDADQGRAAVQQLGATPSCSCST